MNRRDFTLLMADEILFAGKHLKDKEMAIQADWLLRSVYDQYQMFKANRSRCDGTKKISGHQEGKAIDLLVIGRNKVGVLDLLDPMMACPAEWMEIRRHWSDLGGEAMLPWDVCHFEVE